MQGSWLYLFLFATFFMVLSGTSSRRKESRSEFPTMLDLTFEEFEKATAASDVALIPIGAVEEHGPHLPLGTDSILATAQMVDVQRRLKASGVESIVAPALNVGITTEAADWSRDGTYMYPGSLTVSSDTFVALYVDVIRSLHDQGLRRFFLYSAHFGPRHLKAVARIADEASTKVPGVSVRALIPSESAARLGLSSAGHVLVIDKGRNFELLGKFLGDRKEALPNSLHADGAETSEMLHRQPASVREGYAKVAISNSARFFESYFSGKREENPTGTGGFPTIRASAAAGKAIADYRTGVISSAIVSSLGARSRQAGQ